MSSVEHPPLGALELATFRRGPFICLSGFHEVALGDAPVYDRDDYSSEDSDGPRPASAKAERKKKKRGSGGGDEGGGRDGQQQQLQQRQQQQPKRRKGKKAEAAAAAAEAPGDHREREEDDDGGQEHWVQCDRCSRWRVVPPDFWPGVEGDPRPHWFCERARWDVRGWEPFEAACPQR